MKILYVITQGDFGGAQKYVFDLACAAKSKGDEPVVAIGRSKEKTLSQKLGEQGIAVKQLQYLVREISPVNDLKAISEFKNLYKELQPDIIHLNSSKAGIVGALAFHSVGLKKSRLVYTAHGWVFNEPMNFAKKCLYIYLEKFTARYKDKIICVSDYDKAVGQKYRIAPVSKLVSIHNGLEDIADQFQPKAGAVSELFGDFLPTGKIVGTVANFYATKGLEYLIDAADILINREKQNLIFAIIGDGELRLRLEAKIAGYNLKNKVLLLGKIDNARKLLKAFDIIAMSSVKEGFPYSILEAMASGMPIVSTSVGGIPEAIVDKVNGLLVEPKNPGALAEAIKYLLDNPQAAEKMAEQGRKDVAEKFSKEKMISETWSVYDELIKN